MAYTTINKGSDYFNTLLYTGTGSAQSLTGVGFQPDLCFFGKRSATSDHAIFDVIRGATKTIYSNLTIAEVTKTLALTSFDSDGFSLGGASGETNDSGGTYVAWNWLAGGTGVSNTDGSITSTVSASTTSGFSIVTYTGTGSNATVGHGLGSNAKMVIVKRTDTTGNWVCWHTGLTSGTYYIALNSTDAQASNSSVWNSTIPTSSVFSLGTNTDLNGSGGTYVAYCFAEKKGFSKFGSYTGNNNADGTFVYTGFKPAFVMIKKSGGAGNNWVIVDNKRINYNPKNYSLFPNLSNAEDTTDRIDLLSNGFKIRTTGGDFNHTLQYIYMAFAEHPLVSSSGVPCTAR